MIFALVRKTKIPSKRASSASLPASISNEWAPRDPTLRQIAPIGGIADQRLVALLQLCIERGDDRFALLAVVPASSSLRQTT